MTQSAQLKKFLSRIKTFKTEQEAIDVVNQLSTEDLYYYYPQPPNRSLLQVAIHANNIFAVKALLNRSQHFRTHEAFSHLSTFDDTTLEIIKVLKEEKNGFSVNWPLQTNDKNAVAFDLFDVIYNSQRKLAPEFAIELLPDILQVTQYEILGCLDAKTLQYIFFSRSEIFTEEVMKNLYTNIIDHDLLMLPELAAVFDLLTSKQISNVMKNLINYLDIRNDENYRNSFTKHFVQLLKFPETISVINLALNQLLVIIYLRCMEETKKIPEIQADFKFLYSLLDLTQLHLNDEQKKQINFSSSLQFFFKSKLAKITDLNNRQSHFSLQSTDKSFDEYSCLQQLISDLNSLNDRLFFLETICTDFRSENSIIKPEELSFTSSYGNFFVEQLFWHEPELLAELIHVSNKTFVSFYDTVNALALTHQQKTPAIILNVLRMHHISAWHVDFTTVAKSHFLSSANFFRTADITNIVASYLTYPSNTLVKFAFAGIIHPEDAPKANERDAATIHKNYNYYSQILNNLKNILPLIEQNATLISEKIEIGKAYGEAKNNLQPHVLVIKQKELKSQYQTLQTEKLKNDKLINEYLKAFFDLQEKLQKQYISSFSIDTKILDEFWQKSVPSNVFYSFSDFYHNKQKAIEYAKSNTQEESYEPEFKKPKI